MVERASTVLCEPVLPVERDEKGHPDGGAVQFPAAAEAYVDYSEWLTRRGERDGRGVTDA